MTETLHSFVAGRWTSATDAYEIRSPATGALLALAQRATSADVDRAANAAADAARARRHTPLADRVAWCVAVAERIEARTADLARELAEEHGKTLAEATAEVQAGARGFRLAAAEAERLDGSIPPVADPHKRVSVIRQPLGAWAIVTPWNFPFNIPIEYLGPAVATASAFVWKPAPTTSRIAVRLCALMLEAGVPEDLVNLVLTDEVDVAAGLVTHPAIAAVGLTGGSATGRAVAQAAWDKHLLLELGGNGPVIVLDDADLERAIPAVAASAFANAGQVCSAAGRVLAAEGIAGELVAGLAEAAAGIVVGPPEDQRATMGPVHVEAVAATMDRHVADAAGSGADVVTGGARLEGRPTSLYYAPTVLDRVAPGALLDREETFGPLAAVVRHRDDEALLAAANSSSTGLVAAVFTSSLRRAHWFAERLESGSVVVNDTSNYWELHLPFGGWAGKESGRGRLGGRHTLEQFTQLKTISFDVR
ncbi:MAG TPA: aldehyde dehydrogenase family protein [Capillimicrobium sp.]|nr:aldehyde dehydrogenase family protein [Capillimicrobium sp.]